MEINLIIDFLYFPISIISSILFFTIFKKHLHIISNESSFADSSSESFSNMLRRFVLLVNFLVIVALIAELGPLIEVHGLEIFLGKRIEWIIISLAGMFGAWRSILHDQTFTNHLLKHREFLASTIPELEEFLQSNKIILKNENKNNNLWKGFVIHLEKAVMEIENDIEALKKSTKQNESKKSGLEEGKEKLSNEQRRLVEKGNQLGSEIKNLEMRCKEIEHSTDEIEKQIGLLEKTLSQARKNATDASGENQDTSEHYIDLEKEIESTLEKYTAKMGAIHSETDKIKVQNLNLQKKLLHLTKTESLTIQLRDDVKRETPNLVSKIKELEKGVDAKDVAVVSLKTKEYQKELLEELKNCDKCGKKKSECECDVGGRTKYPFS
jgi:hypothetical protein